MKTETADFVPAMRQGEPCPYCGGPTVNVADEFVTCGAAWNRECFGHQVQTPIHHLPGHDETMTALNALSIRK